MCNNAKWSWHSLFVLHTDPFKVCGNEINVSLKEVILSGFDCSLTQIYMHMRTFTEHCSNPALLVPGALLFTPYWSVHQCVKVCELWFLLLVTLCVSLFATALLALCCFAVFCFALLCLCLMVCLLITTCSRFVCFLLFCHFQICISILPTSFICLSFTENGKRAFHWQIQFSVPNRHQSER